MDNQDRPNYSGEEHFYHPRPPRSPQPFWRENLATTIACLLLVLLIIFVSITCVLLERLSSLSSQGSTASKNSATSSVPTPAPSVLAPTSSVPTPAPPSVTASTPPSSSVTSELPCAVDLSTWKTGSADWEILNGVLLNTGTNENFPDGPTIVAPCQLGNTVNYAVETKIQVISGTD